MSKPKGARKREIRKQMSPRLIESRMQKLEGDWRGERLSRIRTLIKEADPEAIEEAKWMKPTNPLGTPVWSHGGVICTIETYKNHVKMTFPMGASLDDPLGLFNASLDARLWRAIDLHEGDKVNEEALKTLIRAAVALNTFA